MKARELDLRDIQTVNAELDRLLVGGYEQAGNWDLAQVCDHLAFFIDQSLDGQTVKVPWILKVLLGRLMLRRILKQRRMKENGPTPQKPLPNPGGDAAAAVARLKAALARLDAHRGELHASPFFGYLTPAQWRELHLIHCGHHLGFMIPKGKTS
jgi:hypothetical protein